jgi:hypothetical protein
MAEVQIDIYTKSKCQDKYPRFILGKKKLATNEKSVITLQ